jgi:hypothetical protein
LVRILKVSLPDVVPKIRKTNVTTKVNKIPNLSQSYLLLRVLYQMRSVKGIKGVEGLRHLALRT